ncbi:MAG: DUF4437 domain-containing protein [Nannocystaceae bacterium]|nr:DUF4437 domain-containing protein [bacterium]
MRTKLLVVLAVAGCASSPETTRVDEPRVAAADSAVTVVLASQVQWGPLNPTRGKESPLAGTLCGDPEGDQPGGVLVKLSAGSAGTIRSHDSNLRIVVIQGRPAPVGEVAGQATGLEPGSFLSANGGDHPFTCEGGDDCVLYVRTEGEVDVGPARSLHHEIGKQREPSG